MLSANLFATHKVESQPCITANTAINSNQIHGFGMAGLDDLNRFVHFFEMPRCPAVPFRGSTRDDRHFSILNHKWFVRFHWWYHLHPVATTVSPFFSCKFWCQYSSMPRDRLCVLDSIFILSLNEDLIFQRFCFSSGPGFWIDNKKPGQCFNLENDKYTSWPEKLREQILIINWILSKSFYLVLYWNEKGGFDLLY